MLMMLALWGELGPADAHDAGALGRDAPHKVQLMLMMLCFEATWPS